MAEFSAQSEQRADYALGHSGKELERLERQARLVDPITRRFFSAAGIVPGMRVLDAGSGAGDVAILAADLVGATGEVVGVDRSAVALERARARAASRSLKNVSFHEGDLRAVKSDRPFDAVIGRYVLMFQSDPTGALRDLAVHVRPGGVAVFHEIDWNGFRCTPAVPSYLKARDWIVATLSRTGAQPHMGIKLAATFIGAGLALPTLRTESLIGGGANAEEPMRRIADIAATLAPETARLGIASIEEMGVETLAQRMLREAAESGSTVVGTSEIGAWCRV